LVNTVERLASLLVWVLLLAILLPLTFFIYRRFFATLGIEETGARNRLDEAARLERKGAHLKAAALYGNHKDYAKAALLFERGNDLARAAEMHEHLGNQVKAAQLHLRSGGSARAAALLAKAGDFAGAADIFRNKGDSLRAAQALELSGDKATAAREFREAGHYERAARLLKEEGLFSEAADTYRLLLKDRNLDASTVEQYYSYAALLALAGETGTAAALYSTILQTCGDYRKAKGNLRALGYGPEVLPSRGDSLSPPPPAGPSRTGAVPVQDHPEPPGQVSVPLSPDTASLREEFNDSIVEEGSGTGRFRETTTLRNIITYGRLEYQYSMRLWIQVMRALADKHREKVFYGCLTPDSLSVDMQNNVTIAPQQELREPYAAPEVLLGEPAGPHSDIYSMGVILFEMVTGSLESFRVKRPLEIRTDIPDWLDELVVKCTLKDRRDRYLSTDEISSALMEIKKSI
jgi:tetratricopeptide (TPR) repeat protein